MRRLAPVLIASLAFVASCSGSSRGSALTTASSPPDESMSPDSPLTAPTSIFPPVASPSATYPAGTGTKEIRITRNGFEPNELVAVIGFPLVWRNETDSAQSVHFLNQDPALGATFSGAIQPGETWAFVPDRMSSVIYTSVESPTFVGVFRSEPARAPGETIPELGPEPTTTTTPGG